jgi:low affinity Fe/Cu permease
MTIREVQMQERPSQIGDERSWFDRFAELSASFVSRAVFFTAAFVVVLVWMPLIVVFESVDTWQLVLNTVTSVIAFLLIALLQNTERRNDRALHRKLDTLAVALADSMAAEGDERLQESIDELRAVVSLEKQI